MGYKVTVGADCQDFVGDEPNSISHSVGPGVCRSRRVERALLRKMSDVYGLRAAHTSAPAGDDNLINIHSNHPRLAVTRMDCIAIAYTFQRTTPSSCTGERPTDSEHRPVIMALQNRKRERQLRFQALQAGVIPTGIGPQQQASQDQGTSLCQEPSFLRRELWEPGRRWHTHL